MTAPTKLEQFERMILRLGVTAKIQRHPDGTLTIMVALPQMIETERIDHAEFAIMDTAAQFDVLTRPVTRLVDRVEHHMRSSFDVRPSDIDAINEQVDKLDRTLEQVQGLSWQVARSISLELTSLRDLITRARDRHQRVHIDGQILSSEQPTDRSQNVSGARTTPG